MIVINGFLVTDIVITLCPIPRIKFVNMDYGYKLTRIQFPVRLCFAMTINKSQGQTLTKAGIYLADPCFGHGQSMFIFSHIYLFIR